MKYKKVNCNHLAKPLEFKRNIYGDEVNRLSGHRSIWICSECGKEIYRDYIFDQGEVSDGYHTFNELYDHRAKLFATLCNNNKNIAWKSKSHDDGTMYDGMFIVGINTPEGQATYHYDIYPYWDMFNVKEIEKAPKFDGHTPTDAINRIFNYLGGGKLK